MRQTALALLLVAAVVPQAGAADSSLSLETRKTAAALRDLAFSGTRATEWARSLADRVGPRSAGSDGDRRAVAWGLATMKALGFSNVHTEKSSSRSGREAPSRARSSLPTASP